MRMWPTIKNLMERSGKTEKCLWIVQLECTYKVHNKSISRNASLETVPLKKKHI